MVAVGRLLGAWRPDRLVRAGGLQTTRWRGVTSGGKALALASALVVGGSGQGMIHRIQRRRELGGLPLESGQTVN